MDRAKASPGNSLPPGNLGEPGRAFCSQRADLVTEPGREKAGVSWLLPPDTESIPKIFQTRHNDVIKAVWFCSSLIHCFRLSFGSWAVIFFKVQNASELVIQSVYLPPRTCFGNHLKLSNILILSRYDNCIIWYCLVPQPTCCWESQMGTLSRCCILTTIREAIRQEKCSFFNIVQKAFDPPPFI